MEINNDKKEVFNFILQSINTGQIKLLLAGDFMAGKSYFLSYLRDVFKNDFNTILLNERTIFNLFNIFILNDYKELELPFSAGKIKVIYDKEFYTVPDRKDRKYLYILKNNYKNKYKNELVLNTYGNKNLILLDNVNLLSLDIIDFLNKALQFFFSNNLLFGGIHIVMTGNYFYKRFSKNNIFDLCIYKNLEKNIFYDFCFKELPIEKIKIFKNVIIRKDVNNFKDINFFQSDSIFLSEGKKYIYKQNLKFLNNLSSNEVYKIKSYKDIDKDFIDYNSLCDTLEVKNNSKIFFNMSLPDFNINKGNFGKFICLEKDGEETLNVDLDLSNYKNVKAKILCRNKLISIPPYMLLIKKKGKIILQKIQFPFKLAWYIDFNDFTYVSEETGKIIIDVNNNFNRNILIRYLIKFKSSENIFFKNTVLLNHLLSDEGSILAEEKTKILKKVCLE